MKKILITLTIILIASFTQAQNPNMQKIVVEEVIQAAGYTYILNKTPNGSQWLATVKVDAKVGEIYYYKDGMEMVDFRSAELDRTFDSIIFLQGVISDEELLLGAKPNTGPSPHGTPPTVAGSKDIKIELPKGGISIKDLMANKDSYESKEVLVRGKVVKYNSGIMNKNWIHIQDGTANGSENDLTVTTDMEAKVGDVITVYGTVVLNKDLGAGYFYKIILEDAKIMD